MKNIIYAARIESLSIEYDMIKNFFVAELLSAESLHFHGTRLRNKIEFYQKKLQLF